MNTLTIYEIIEKMRTFKISTKKLIDIFVMLIDEQFDELDEEEQFLAVINSQEIINLMDYMIQEMINSISDQTVREYLSGELAKEREESNQLIISKDYLDNLKAQYLGDTKIISELNDLDKYMQKINKAEESFSIFLNNSPYKIYYEYILTKKGPDETKFLISDEDALSKEIAKLDHIKAVMFAAGDKTMDELPNSKKEMAGSMLIPPSMVRSIPSGMPVFLVYKSIDRVRLVADYFLTKLTEPDADKEEYDPDDDYEEDLSYLEEDDVNEDYEVEEENNTTGDTLNS